MKNLIIILSIFITGCAYTPSKQELSNANYGSAPSNIEKSIKYQLFKTLKDPDSAKIKYITEPKKDFFLNPENFNTKLSYGWHVCAFINAKNTYGTYAGYKQYHFFFINNEIVYTTDYAMNSGRTLSCK